MRKFISLLPVVAVALVMFSCKEEPRNTEPLVDPWLRARTPQALRLESQVGAAVITDNWRDDSKGTISVTIVTPAVDLGAVAISQLDLPAGATADVEPGDTLDFSEGNPTITVTSQNGTTRAYVVSYNDFVEPFVGTYRMNVIPGILGGGNPNCVVALGSWDGDFVASTVGDKGWNFPNGGTADNDNILSFALTEVDDQTGTTYGTCVHNSGDDGIFQEYTWNNNPEWGDRNGYYRQVPIGKSRWEKRVEKVGDDDVTRIYFYDYDTEEPLLDALGDPQYCDLYDTGNYSYADPGSDNIRVIPVAFQALHHSWPGPYDEHYNEWSDYRWLFFNIRETFLLVEKTADEPSPDHETWLAQ